MMPGMRRSAGCAALTLILAACGTEAPRPSASPTPAPPTPVASPTSTPTVASGSGFARDTVVTVLRDGLTLRDGPGTAYEPVGARALVGTGVGSAGAPYVLAVGERLLIQEGPLYVEGTDWYSVRAADMPEMEDMIFTEGWVPAGDGEGEYLEPIPGPARSCCFWAAGVGSGVTVAVPPPTACSPSECGRVIAWVAGLSEPADTCPLRITQALTGAVIAEELISGWARGGTWWLEQEGAGVVVETECSWSVHIGPA